MSGNKEDKKSSPLKTGIFAKNIVYKEVLTS